MGWQDDLVPAAFAGVPFQAEAHNHNGGRRLAVHEFPLRDHPATDDLGRAARKYRLRGFVFGDVVDGSYADARDALKAALDTRGVALLDHPWAGPGLRVRAGAYTCTESTSDGGIAMFDMEFVEAGGSASPLAQPDTASAVLDGTGTAMGVLATALAIGADIAAAPDALLSFAGGLLITAGLEVDLTLGGIAGVITATLQPLGAAAAAVIDAVSAAQAACSALPGSAELGGAPVTSAVTGITGDPVAVAVTDMMALAAQAVLAVQTAPPDASDAIGGQLYTAQRLAADPTLGLVALASYGSTFPAPTGLYGARQAGLQRDLLALITGAATLAVAQIYASTNFISGNAAATARQTILALIQAQIEYAAAAANDPLYQAWVGLAGTISQDLLVRVMQLPVLTTYSVGRTLPACVIAQMLYGDGTRGTELALLNDIPHPGFMPPTGVALSS